MKQQKHNQKDKQNTKVVQQSSVITSDRDKELEYEINKLKKELPMVDLELLDDKRIAQLIMIAELKGRQDMRKELIEEEKEYLEFLLSNRLHSEYSIRDLRREILYRLNKLKEKKE